MTCGAGCADRVGKTVNDRSTSRQASTPTAAELPNRNTILRLFGTALLGFLVLLGGCGRNPVETDEQAIAAGSAVCAREWRRSYPTLDFAALDWKARFYHGDRWMVWVDGPGNSRLEVIVPKSGEPVSSCAIYGHFANRNEKLR